MLQTSATADASSFLEGAIVGIVIGTVALLAMALVLAAFGLKQADSVAST